MSIPASLQDPTLLERLACPRCRSRLEPSPTVDGLHCAPCRAVYPIRAGLPILLVEEARTGPAAGDADRDRVDG